MLLVFLIVVAVGSIWGGHLLLNRPRLRLAAQKKAEIVEKAKQEETYSIPSVAILGQFDVTPVENQPISRYELEASLEALDFKYGQGRVHRHFDVSRYNQHVNFKMCDCQSTIAGSVSRHNHDKGMPCKMPEYREIYNSLIAIKYALKAQEKALVEVRRREELAGRQVDLERVAELTKSLRDEAALLNEVARELA